MYLIITIKDNCSLLVSNRFHSKLVKAITHNTIASVIDVLQDHSNVYEHFTLDVCNSAFVISHDCHMIQVDDQIDSIFHMSHVTLAVFPSPITTRALSMMFSEFVANTTPDVTSQLANTPSCIKRKSIPIQLHLKPTSSIQDVTVYLANIDSVVGVLKNVKVIKWLQSKMTSEEFSSLLASTWKLLTHQEAKGILHVFKVNDLKHLPFNAAEFQDVLKATIGAQVAKDLIDFANTSNLFITGGIMNKLLNDSTVSDDCSVDVLYVNTFPIGFMFVDNSYISFAKLIKAYTRPYNERANVIIHITVTCALTCDVPYARMEHQEPLHLTDTNYAESKYHFSMNPDYIKPQNNSSILKAYQELVKQYGPFNLPKITMNCNYKIKVLMNMIIDSVTRRIIRTFSNTQHIHELNATHRLSIQFITSNTTKIAYNTHAQVTINTDEANQPVTIRFVNIKNTDNTNNNCFLSAINHINTSDHYKSKAFWNHGQVYATPSALTFQSTPSSTQPMPHTNWVHRLGYNIIVNILFSLPTIKHVMSACIALGIKLHVFDLARLLQRKINELYREDTPTNPIIDVANTPMSHASLDIWRDTYTHRDFLIKLVARNALSPIDFFPRQGLITMLNTCSRYTIDCQPKYMPIDYDPKYKNMVANSYSFDTAQIYLDDQDHTCISFKPNKLSVRRKLGKMMYELAISIQDGVPIIQLTKHQSWTLRYDRSIYRPMNQLDYNMYYDWTCLSALVTCSSIRSFEYLKYELGNDTSNTHYTYKIQVKSGVIVISYPKNDLNVLNCSIIKINDGNVSNTRVYQYALGNKNLYPVYLDYIVESGFYDFTLVTNMKSHNFEFDPCVASHAQDYHDNKLTKPLMLNYIIINLIKYYERHGTVPLELCELTLVGKTDADKC
ncbi:Hypothetical protein MVR_LOCUS380 [uncultured virus]|nr:Hypothetical protein MVR_LOCUS380 [uncultured virus]